MASENQSLVLFKQLIIDGKAEILKFLAKSFKQKQPNNQWLECLKYKKYDSNQLNANRNKNSHGLKCF